MPKKRKLKGFDILAVNKNKDDSAIIVAVAAKTATQAKILARRWFAKRKRLSPSKVNVSTEDTYPLEDRDLRNKLGVQKKVG